MCLAVLWVSRATMSRQYEIRRCRQRQNLMAWARHARDEGNDRNTEKTNMGRYRPITTTKSTTMPPQARAQWKNRVDFSARTRRGFTSDDEDE